MKNSFNWKYKNCQTVPWLFKHHYIYKNFKTQFEIVFGLLWEISAIGTGNTQNL